MDINWTYPTATYGTKILAFILLVHLFRFTQLTLGLYGLPKWTLKIKKVVKCEEVKSHRNA